MENKGARTEKGFIDHYQQATEKARQQGYGNLIDELTYSNYRHNRTISPDVTPEEWKAVYSFTNVDALERRFQAESRKVCCGRNSN